MNDIITLVARDGILAIVLVLQMFYIGAKLDRLSAAIFRHEGRGHTEDE